MPKANITSKKTSKDDISHLFPGTLGSDIGALNIVLSTLCVLAVIVTAVGAAMALIPGSSNPYLASDMQLAREAAHVVQGQFLAILGAIVATGTGIILTLRTKH